MIRTIKLNNCTPYKHAEVCDCKKINFIFGANGSGKSTISSFLANLHDVRFATSTVEWIGEAHEKIEVYNKAFRVANLQQDMQGIFTLGSDAIGDIKTLKDLKENLERLIKDHKGLCTSYEREEKKKSNLEEQFKEDAWTQILKNGEADFQKAFEGLRNSKEKFVTELKKRVKGISGHIGTISQREVLIQRARTLYAPKPERRSLFILDIAQLLKKISDIRTDVIWNTVIAGSKDVDIAMLIYELGNSSWVGQGRYYLKPNSNKCPFCQQETITENFRNKLETFFNTEYKQRIDRLTMLLADYQNFSKQLLEAIESVVQDREASIETGQLNLEIFMTKKDLLKATLASNAEKIKDKIMEPGIKITIDDESELIAEIKKLLDDANTIIEAHNALINKRDIEEIVLRDNMYP